MFGLVIFTDEVLYVCNTDEIFVSKKKCSVRYGKKNKYAARVLALHATSDVLEKIKEKLEIDEVFSSNIYILANDEGGFEYNGAVEKIANKRGNKTENRNPLYMEEILVLFFGSNNDSSADFYSIVRNERNFFESGLHFFEVTVSFCEKQVNINSTEVNDDSVSMNVPEQTTDQQEEKNQKDKTANELNLTYILDISAIDKMSTSLNGPELTSLTANDLACMELYPARSNECNPKIQENNEQEQLPKKLRIISDEIISFPFLESFSHNKMSSESFGAENVSNDLENGTSSTNVTELLNIGGWSTSTTVMTAPFEFHVAEKTNNIEKNDEDVSMEDDSKDDFDNKAEDVSNDFENKINSTDVNDSLDIGRCSTSTTLMSTLFKSEVAEKTIIMGKDGEYMPMEDESEDLSDDEDRKSSHEISLNITLGLNKPGISAPDDIDLRVGVSSTPSYQKKHFCFYCQKFQTKIARHLQTVHSKEDDVKKFSSLPINNCERKNIIAIIRKKGNHLFNNDRRFNTGELLVCRRPNERLRKSAQDFIACGVCKGQYSKSVIRHHWRKCTNRDGKNERIITISGKKVTARLHEKANHLVRKYIFPYLREDKIVRGIRYDELVIMYANKQCEKYGTHQHHFQMIRARLRLLGRFLDAMKKINPVIVSLADIFTPRHYDNAVSAVRIVAGFDEENRTFAHPAVASNLGTLLKCCGDLLRSEYIKRESECEQKRVEDFLKLQVEDYGTSINRAVSETQAQRNRRKKVVLPTTADIKKLDAYLRDERTTYFQELKKAYSYNAWRKLAENTLISLQLFNRRRPGEIERIYVDDFKNYQGLDSIAEKEAYDSLSADGKKIARQYIRFEIRGKLGRGVPVLVHNELFDCLELILQYRNDADVPQSNPYLFGLPSSDKDRCKYIRACRLMHEYSQKCNAVIPSTLRGTKLRKHIATHCIDLNLSDGQVADLANFMGHEEKIHKDIYRQPILKTDIVGMSKILKTAQGYASSSESEDSGDEKFNISQKCSNKKANLQSNDHTKISASPEMPMAVKCRRWTDTQRKTVLNRFKSILESDEMPTSKEMRDLITQEDCLKDKTLPQIRTWLHGQKKKLLK